MRRITMEGVSMSMQRRVCSPPSVTGNHRGCLSNRHHLETHPVNASNHPPCSSPAFLLCARIDGMDRLSNGSRPPAMTTQGHSYERPGGADTTTAKCRSNVTKADYPLAYASASAALCGLASQTLSSTACENSS